MGRHSLHCAAISRAQSASKGSSREREQSSAGAESTLVRPTCNLGILLCGKSLEQITWFLYLGNLYLGKCRQSHLPVQSTCCAVSVLDCCSRGALLSCAPPCRHASLPCLARARALGPLVRSALCPVLLLRCLCSGLLFAWRTSVVCAPLQVCITVQSIHIHIHNHRLLRVPLACDVYNHYTAHVVYLVLTRARRRANTSPRPC